MKAITLHNIDDKLYGLVALEAARRGWSLNKTAKELLSTAVGNGKKPTKINVAKYFGVLSAKETKELDRAIIETEKIYSGDWA